MQAKWVSTKTKYGLKGGGGACYSTRKPHEHTKPSALLEVVRTGVRPEEEKRKKEAAEAAAAAAAAAEAEANRS